MPKKRKNSGKNKSGKDGFVQCAKCGRAVPRSKAKRITKRVRIAEPQIERELRQAGAILPRATRSMWYCVSCAVHGHVVNIRSDSNRKNKDRLR
ncbi:MAG: 30S ribosomal protein S26e [Candidatus Lokiarchaeota archaeon]|nr:30S ribosomal protein S26e [Candidatus Lokiarchaeota archaeon]